MEDRELRNLKAFYTNDSFRRPIGKMTGEMPAIIKLAVGYGATMGFDLAVNRKKIWGVPVDFNDFTGRITVKIGGEGKSPYATTFLIRAVKQFDFAWELWEEYDTNRTGK